MDKDEFIEDDASEYENLTELDWVKYEFATIEYDFQINPIAARRIEALFERLYNAKNN